jgi:uncharacterized protein (TIGR03067 family)
MKTLVSLAAFAASALIAGAADEAGFTSLFNGKDLTGWDGRPEHWSVEDGAITGKTTKENPAKGNNFLFWRPDGKNATVENFELRCSYRIVANNTKGFANSGVQYRSKDKGNFVAAGYQADFENGKTYSGILYDEAGGAGGRQVMANRGEKVEWTAECQKKVTGSLGTSSDIQDKIKEADWNDYVVIANGNHLQHFINGVPTVDVIDNCEAKRLASGILALQLHAGEPMTVQFKNIRIKKLGGDSAGLLQKMIGKWVPTEATYNGEAVDRDRLDGSLLTVMEGGKYTSKRGERTDEGVITLDESKMPMTMDMERKRSNGDTQTIPAILEMKGEILRICYAFGDSATRPNEFKSEADSGRALVTYKRD